MDPQKHGTFGASCAAAATGFDSIIHRVITKMAIIIVYVGVVCSMKWDEQKGRLACYGGGGTAANTKKLSEIMAASHDDVKLAL